MGIPQVRSAPPGWFQDFRELTPAMAGIGVFVLWLGYSIGYYGFDQIRGGNNGFLSLVLPGKFSEQPADPPNSPASGATTGSGQGIAVPTKSNPAGVSVWSPVGAPKGAPAGNYRVNQDGTIQKQASNGAWQLYTTPNQTTPPLTA